MVKSESERQAKWKNCKLFITTSNQQNKSSKNLVSKLTLFIISRIITLTSFKWTINYLIEAHHQRWIYAQNWIERWDNISHYDFHALFAKLIKYKQTFESNTFYRYKKILTAIKFIRSWLTMTTISSVCTDKRVLKFVRVY